MIKLDGGLQITTRFATLQYPYPTLGSLHPPQADGANPQRLSQVTQISCWAAWWGEGQGK